MTEMEWLDEFGASLFDLMEQEGLNQKELAEESGLSEGSISNYIHGKQMPNVKAIVNLAYALECDVSDLIDFGEMID